MSLAASVSPETAQAGGGTPPREPAFECLKGLYHALTRARHAYLAHRRDAHGARFTMLPTPARDLGICATCTRLGMEDAAAARVYGNAARELIG